MRKSAFIVAVIIFVNIFIPSVAFATHEPSDWAKGELEQAIDAGLVPQDLQRGYQNYCTREEFCRLVIALVEAVMGKDVSEIFSERGMIMESGVFNDTENKDIEAAYTLGIVNGVGNGMFSPNGDITREQAAVMLMRASNVLGYTPAGKVLSFSDRDEFSDYAVKGIDFVAKAGVMNGVANNKFSPRGNYTREMSCLTMVRLYNAVEENSEANANVSSSDDGVLSAQEIFKKCSPGIFHISVFNSDGSALGSGSGFFITSDGVLVTNFHVIENAYSASIKLHDGTTAKIDKVLGYSLEKDIAVLKADISEVIALTLGDSSNISSGQKVYAIGSPLGLENSISDGIVSNPYREEVGGIQITAAISAGSSGGALLDEKGDVIGVTFGAIEEGQSLNFAIPINEVKKISKDASKSFQQVIAETDKNNYNNRAGMFEEVYAESEPNDSEASANVLENGYSVLGNITSSKMDVFEVKCNSKGSARVYFKSTSRMASDLVLAIAPRGKATKENLVFADGGYSDGAYYLTVEYPVDEVGYYNIYVMSNKLAFITSVNIEYLFYYEFEPV